MEGLFLRRVLVETGTLVGEAKFVMQKQKVASVFQLYYINLAKRTPLPGLYRYLLQASPGSDARYRQGLAVCSPTG